MNVQEILAQIDHAITEIDLLLHEWQEGLDMMSFLGVNATFELWTTDIPPRLVTKDVLAQAAGKELRVMNYLGGGEPTQVGTAVIDENGMIRATITEDIPELRNGMLNHFSIDERGKWEWKPLPSERALEPQSPLAHFRIDKDGVVHPKLGNGTHFWGDIIEQNTGVNINEVIKNIENHRFFKEN